MLPLFPGPRLLLFASATDFSCFFPFPGGCSKGMESCSEFWDSGAVGTENVFGVVQCVQVCGIWGILFPGFGMLEKLRVNGGATVNLFIGNCRSEFYIKMSAI